MSLISGLFPLPIYVILSFVLGDDIHGFMDLGNLGTNNFNIMTKFFNSNYTTIILLSILAILYTLKPIATTSFILSVPSALSYLAVDVLAKLFFVFATLIFVEEKATVSQFEALGLFLAILSQFLIYACSEGFKESREIKSACEAIKNHFAPYNSFEEAEEVNKRLAFVASSFGSQDVYRILFDVALADQIKQL